MSRAAALDARKGEQKAAIALKAAEHAADLAMGLTATMAKIIKQDELICTACGATKLGPITKCECSGGRSKPGEACGRTWENLGAARPPAQDDATQQPGERDEASASAPQRWISHAASITAIGAPHSPSPGLMTLPSVYAPPLWLSVFNTPAPIPQARTSAPRSCCSRPPRGEAVLQNPPR